MGFALNQPGMGQGVEDFVPGGSVLPVSMTQSGSILDLIMGTGASVLQSITQPDMVKAAMNKYIYGVTSPTSGSYVASPPASSIIAGVPNTYLLIGAAAVGLILLKKKR